MTHGAGDERCADYRLSFLDFLFLNFVKLVVVNRLLLCFNFSIMLKIR